MKNPIQLQNEHFKLLHKIEAKTCRLYRKFEIRTFI